MSCQLSEASILLHVTILVIVRDKRQLTCRCSWNLPLSVYDHAQLKRVDISHTWSQTLASIEAPSVIIGQWPTSGSTTTVILRHQKYNHQDNVQLENHRPTLYISTDLTLTELRLIVAVTSLSIDCTLALVRIITISVLRVPYWTHATLFVAHPLIHRA